MSWIVILNVIEGCNRKDITQKYVGEETFILESTSYKVNLLIYYYIECKHFHITLRKCYVLNKKT